MKTKTELVDARAQALNVIDDILKTAKEANRSLTPEERELHDTTVASIEGDDGLDAQIVRATEDEGDITRFAAGDARRSRYAVPNINVTGTQSVGAGVTRYAVPNINVTGTQSVGAGVTRNLDDLLWATSDVVRASNGRTEIPVEQIIVRSHVNDPGHIAPRIGAFQPADREVVRSFQQLVSDMCIVGMMVDRDANTSKKGFQVARSLPHYREQWQHVMRALDTDTSAEGTEWVPTGIGASLHEKVRASGKIAPLFQTINLPTNPWKWPLEGADATAFRVAEPTADNASAVTASTPGTAAATFDAEIFGARTLWSKSVDADSAIAMAGFVTQKLVQAFVDAKEKAILDGDTDGTHQDTDVHALGATDARWAWDGLRKRALAQTVVTATTTTAANLALLRAGMLRWGINPANLAFIIGLSAYYDLLADTSLLTVDKLGPQATILNGQVGSVHGVPVIVSEHVRENLNASGIHDGITETKTYNLCVNRNEFALGQRMALDVETNDVLYLETFQRVAVAFERVDFQSISAAATDDTVAISFNVTP